MQPTLIYITAPNREEAILLSRELLGERLVACANIIEHVTSLYWWNAEIEQGNEVVIIVKTAESYVERIISLVKRLHSYDCPAIVAVPIVQGSPEYMEWIHKQLLTPEHLS